MTEKVALSFRDRNPDVLTSIANLSNDEVFTPPEFANQMLDVVAAAWAKANDGENIWANPKVTFLDPFTKSGVFLREITRRLSEGLENQIPDTQKRVDHITKNQVFGIAITNLTSLLARRSVYCSKNANGKHSISRAFDNPSGNIWFERQNHIWIGGSNFVLTADEKGNMVKKATDGRCKYCGASQREYDRDEALESHAYALIHAEDPKTLIAKLFGENMKFDVVIGNPPYQMSTGGTGGAGVQAKPIYNSFVLQAKQLDPKYLCMVTPSRWFSGGMGLDNFRETMLKDDRLRVIHDFPDSNDVFRGTQIKGGVSYFLWERDNPGLVSVTTHDKGEVVSASERPLLEPGCDVFIRYNEGVSILRKVFASESNGDKMSGGIPPQKQFMTLVSSIGAFGLDTTFSGKEKYSAGDVKVFRNGGIGYISMQELPKEKHAVAWWKIFIPRAGSGSDAFPHPILGKPFIGEPGTASSWTYMHIGPFNSEVESKNAITYIATKLFRFLVLLHKPTQDATKAVYTFVPTQDFSKPWTDKELYKKYGLNPQEILFIESMIRPMELDNE
jgi:site-specific DNA-methyltransferase (adenine-specific)